MKYIFTCLIIFLSFVTQANSTTDETKDWLSYCQNSSSMGDGCLIITEVSEDTDTCLVQPTWYQSDENYENEYSDEESFLNLVDELLKNGDIGKIIIHYINDSDKTEMIRISRKNLYKLMSLCSIQNNDSGNNSLPEPKGRYLQTDPIGIHSPIKNGFMQTDPIGIRKLK